MKSEEKARPAGGTAEQAAEQVQASRQGHASNDDFNTSRGGGQIQIADLLMHGAENAVPRRHLRQLTGLSDRELRRLIQEERLAGCPILSDNQSGYYLPADDGERARFVCSMRSRTREIEAVAAAVEGVEAN